MLVRRGGFRSSRATSICGPSELSCVTMVLKVSIAVKVDVGNARVFRPTRGGTCRQSSSPRRDLCRHAR